jgi:hypothetical protein
LGDNTIKKVIPPNQQSKTLLDGVQSLQPWTKGFVDEDQALIDSGSPQQIHVK